MQTIAWFREVIPPEILWEISKGCALELSRVDKWFNEYTYNGVLFEDPRCSIDKRFVHDGCSVLQHSSFSNISIKPLNPEANLTLLEWAIIKDHFRLIDILLQKPKFKLTARKSRCIKVAIHYGKLRALKMLRMQRTFLNAVSSVSSYSLLKLVNKSEHMELFYFVYSIPQLTPTQYCINEVISTNSTITEKKLQTIIRHPKVAEYYLPRTNILMEAIVTQFIEDPRLDISLPLKDANWILRSVLHTPKLVDTVIGHPKFALTGSIIGLNGIAGEIISDHRILLSTKVRLVEKTSPTLLYQIVGSSKIDQLSFWKHHYPHLLDTLTERDIYRCISQRAERFSNWDIDEYLFWQQEGKIFCNQVNISLIRSGSNHLTSIHNEKLKQYFSHPNVNVTEVVEEYTNLGVHSMMTIPSSLLCTLLSHPRLLPRVRTMFMCKLMDCTTTSWDMERHTTIIMLLDQKILNPVVDNYFLLLYCAQNGNYRCLQCLRNHPSVKLAEMNKDLIYDEVSRTMSVRISKLVNQKKGEL